MQKSKLIEVQILSALRQSERGLRMNKIYCNIVSGP